MRSHKMFELVEKVKAKLLFLRRRKIYLETGAVV